MEERKLTVGVAIIGLVILVVLVADLVILALVGWALVSRDRLPLKYNLRSLLVRWRLAILSAGGIALVTAIFVALLALGEGLTSVFRSTGHPENLIVLRPGATAESQSSLSKEQTDAIQAVAGIARDAQGRPLASVETLAMGLLPKAEGGDTNALFRGVDPVAFDLRPAIRVEGARPRPGTTEVAVGRAASRRFANMRIGDTFDLQGRTWRVVGIFDAGGAAYESEVWADAQAMRDAWNRGASSMIVRAASEEEAKSLEETISNDPRLVAKAESEIKYYERQTQAGSMIKGLASFAAILLGIGAAFGAANTMYAAVAARTREIATMKVLGFKSWKILASFFIESSVLALVGGLVGCVLAMPVSRISTGTMNWSTFTEIAFHFRVTPVLMAYGVVLALQIGLAGGLFPAIRAARMTPARALREV